MEKMSKKKKHKKNSVANFLLCWKVLVTFSRKALLTLTPSMKSDSVAKKVTNPPLYYYTESTGNLSVTYTCSFFPQTHFVIFIIILP